MPSRASSCRSPPAPSRCARARPCTACRTLVGIFELHGRRPRVQDPTPNDAAGHVAVVAAAGGLCRRPPGGTEKRFGLARRVQHAVGRQRLKLQFIEDFDVEALAREVRAVVRREAVVCRLEIQHRTSNPTQVTGAGDTPADLPHFLIVHHAEAGECNQDDGQKQYHHPLGTGALFRFLRSHAIPALLTPPAGTASSAPPAACAGCRGRPPPGR